MNKKKNNNVYILFSLEQPTEESVFMVTQTLLETYCSRRVRVFYFDCRTKSAMFTNELKKLHGGPSDNIGK